MPKRRLSAIMFTDIQGYTALMRKDEAKAIAMRNRHRGAFEWQHAIAVAAGAFREKNQPAALRQAVAGRRTRAEHQTAEGDERAGDHALTPPSGPSSSPDLRDPGHRDRGHPDLLRYGLPRNSTMCCA